MMMLCKDKKKRRECCSPMAVFWIAAAMGFGAAGTLLYFKRNEAKRAVLETRAAKLTRAAAFANVEAVEEFATSLDRNLPELPVLGFLMDRLAFGTEGK